MLTTFISDFFFAIFPHTCVVCEQHLRNSERVMCSSCLIDIPRVYFHAQERNPLEDLLWGHVPFEHATSLFYYSKMSKYANLLYELKYKNRYDIGVFIGEVFGAELKQSGFLNDVDLIIPIPLHTKRKQRRGYNQSEKIAEGIASYAKIPLCLNAVKRVKNTETQTKKNKEERLKNVEGIFSVAHPQNLLNKHILIVDDVITTGATVISCVNSIMTYSKNVRISIASVGVVV